MKLPSLLLLSVLLLACPAAPSTAPAGEAYWLYLASEDGASGGGIGIYRYDARDGSILAVDTFAGVPASGYLAVAGDRLYSLHSDSSGAGVLTALAIDLATGALQYLDAAPTGGRGPCYVSVAGQSVLVANYSSGTISATAIRPEGLGAQQALVQHSGQSVNPDRQEGPHPHMILPVPGSDLILVPDLGTDQVFAYRLGAAGDLSPAPRPFLAMPPGAGPRHLALHPTRPLAYILHELHGSVSSLRLDPDSGLMATLDTQSILPPDFTAFNKSSDIHVSPDGRHLYAANRGPNSLAIFALDPVTDSMQRVALVDCGGDWPRAFALDPSGRFLLVAHKRSHQLGVFRRDPATGLIEPVATVPTVSSPQGIRFVPIPLN